MRRPSRPLLLAEPSRFAGMSRRGARLALVLIALVLLASLATFRPFGPAEGQADLLLYSGVLEGVRHGGEFYAVTADALRTSGEPAGPLAFHLPSLAIISASMPAALLTAMLWTLGVAVALAWYARLAPALPGTPARIAVLLLLLAGMAVAMQPTQALLHETWAGLLIALSLALWRPGRTVEAIALGLAAALICETAALYLLLMGVLAWREGARREAILWGVAMALFAVVIAAHAHAVAQVVGASVPSQGWTGLLGWSFVVQALTWSSALAALPAWLAALLVSLALAGWAAWRDPVATRTLATLAAYAVLLAISATSNDLHWALLVAPLSLAGLVFIPDGLRDLLAAALDRRRITVTRVVR